MSTLSERILVVEDDTGFLDLICASFRNSGIEVLTASSSQAAYKSLREDSPELLLLDWNLKAPQSVTSETGRDVLKFCREIDSLMPVIVMSGEMRLDVRTDAMLEEADSFLAKPFSMGLLVSHVRRWLKRLRHEREIFKLETGQDVAPLEEIKRRYAQWAVNVLGSVNRAAPKLKIHRHTLANLVNKT